MEKEGFKRKLTAILSADAEGYSRLMGEDEDATIRTLTSYRELMSTLIQKHRGRVVDSPGDNLLAEFGLDPHLCCMDQARRRNFFLDEDISHSLASYHPPFFIFSIYSRVMV